MDMKQPLGHELRADGNVIPNRPTMSEADYHPEIWMQFMRQWADACGMRNRVAPPDGFLYNVNEELHIDDIFGTQPQLMSIEEFFRRIRESGG